MKMADAYEASRRIYGSPKFFQVLKRGGEHVSRKRVARIMRENGWCGVTRRCSRNPEKEKRASKSESAPDLVKRDFSSDGPNKARFADTTYVRTHQGWLRLAVVMDVWSRRVVGAISAVDPVETPSKKQLLADKLMAAIEEA